MLRSKRPFFAVLSVLIAVAGCNCNGTDPDGPDDPALRGLKRLSVTPAEVTLTTVDGAAATQTYSVTGHYDDDSTRDLTDKVSFSLDDPSLGAFSGATFTSSTERGGKTMVRASFDTYSAEAPLTLVLKRTFPVQPPPGGGTPLPPDPGSHFGGDPETDPARLPLLVYPNDGVVVPPNLRELEIHFVRQHRTDDLFEISFTNAITDVRVFLRCGLPDGVRLITSVPSDEACIFTPSAELWRWLSETNRGATPLTVQVRGTSESGGPVGTSEPIRLQIARTELRGALYYWTTSGDSGIMRYDFAGPADAEATRVLGPSDGNGSCLGCHALSRDGKKLFANGNGQNGGHTIIRDLANETEPVGFYDNTERVQFAAWSPDSTRFVGVYADSGATRFGLMMLDGTTGQRLHDVPGTGNNDHPASHPDWSADGSTLVWTRMGVKGTNQRFYNGSIRALEITGEDTYGESFTVVPQESGKNRYYPAISPDGAFLVYNESTCPGGSNGTHCNADSDPSATLWSARLVADAPRVKLERANAPGPTDGGNTQLTNSYPKWSPFDVRGNDGPESRLNWLTFSSNRNFGLRRPPSASNDEAPNGGTLLWMAAVDPDVAAADQDGSYPAFVLPFQDLATSNHIAQWAQFAVVDGCATEGDGCGSGGSACCNGLTCLPKSSDPPLPCEIEGNCTCEIVETCGLTGESCDASSPCCGALSCENPGGGACAGDDCLCQPACGALGQACGTGSPCCGGLLCLGEGATACEGENCSCMPGID
ncbi:MAG TPA: hypothetical protein VK013_18010 [Myxococcaceae bacterium]|nr:hypothetical protein [Myxococcaceae bacterium]